jgi:hypothetical protein
MSWQDISSAPKDGTRVLVVDNDFSDRKPVVAKFVSYVWDEWVLTDEDDVELYTDYGIRGGSQTTNPTHWQPLPEPPQATT